MKPIGNYPLFVYLCVDQFYSCPTNMKLRVECSHSTEQTTIIVKCIAPEAVSNSPYQSKTAQAVVKLLIQSLERGKTKKTGFQGLLEAEWAQLTKANSLWGNSLAGQFNSILII